MPISVLAEVTGYAFRGGGGSGSDLTAPPNPAPVTLAAGATARPSTPIGSWSAPVTVVATCTTDSGAPGPAVTVTGSGAGPYSVAIASGLTTATSYIVTIEGTGADGQVAETCLLVVVAGVVGDLTAPASPSPANLPAGSTALGSTLVGSWSASVTVSALVLASGGPAPTATITGSGAGPYSVSIASGLSNATSYLVILTGTGTDGQVASTSLLVAVAAPADLTAPASPAPVSLAPGTTALGSTALGSWSAPVTVVATCAGSDGSTPAVAVTGSGAGPYSVSVASGLSDGVTYTITATGTGADGQVAPVALSVAVRSAVMGTLGWVTLVDYDLTTVDTGPGTTATTGTLALTTGGGSPFVTLSGISGASTGSIVPVNGQGVVISTASSRGFLIDLDWAALGVNLFRRIVSVDIEIEPVTLTVSSQANLMTVESVSNASVDSNFGGRITGATGPSWTISARTYNAGVSNAATDATVPTTIPSRYSASSIRIPEGLEVCQSLAALPPNPDLHTYTGRRRSQNTAWGAVNAPLTLGADPRPAVFLSSGSGTSEIRVRRIRVMAQGVV